MGEDALFHHINLLSKGLAILLEMRSELDDFVDLLNHQINAEKDVLLLSLWRRGLLVSRVGHGLSPCGGNRRGLVRVPFWNSSCHLSLKIFSHFVDCMVHGLSVELIIDCRSLVELAVEV